jgi:hypothetical protein
LINKNHTFYIFVCNYRLWQHAYSYCNLLLCVRQWWPNTLTLMQAGSYEPFQDAVV